MKDNKKICFGGDWFNAKYEEMNITLVEILSKVNDDAGIIQSSYNGNTKKAPKMPQDCKIVYGVAKNCANYLKCRNIRKS